MRSNRELIAAARLEEIARKYKGYLSNPTHDRITLDGETPYGAMAAAVGDLKLLDDYFFWLKQNVDVREGENPADYLLPFFVTSAGQECSTEEILGVRPLNEHIAKTPPVLITDQASLLTMACAVGNFESCRYLVEEQSASVSVRHGAGGETPLHRAAIQGHAHILAYLLQHLDNEEALNWGDGFTWDFMVNRHLSDPEQCGANRDDGFTPLELALANGHEDCAALLLDAGARPEPVNLEYDNIGPLHIAAEHSSAKTLQLLLAHQAPYKPPCNGVGTRPVLGYAVYSGDPDKIEVLEKAYPGTTDNDPAWADVTATRFAIMLNKSEVVRRLAELNCCDLQKTHIAGFQYPEHLSIDLQNSYKPAPFFVKYLGKEKKKEDKEMEVYEAWEAERDAPEPNLLLAIRKGFWEIIGILLDYGVPLMTEHPRTGDGPLHCLDFKKTERAIEFAERFLRDEPRLLTHKNKAHRSPLAESARRLVSELERRDELVRAEIERNEKKKHRKNFKVVFTKYLKWRDFLIQAGFRDDEPDCEGKTAAEYLAAVAKRVDQ